jgi:polysaccharide export outer membrane protein
LSIAATAKSLNAKSLFCGQLARLHESAGHGAGAVAVALALILGLAGCEELPRLPAGEAGLYRLDAGDQIRVMTYGDDRLSGTFRVSDSGTVEFPLLGPVKARGLTAEGLEGEIAAALQTRQLLNHASVSVQVESYRAVFILGEVSRPGRYPYEPGMTVLTAVAAAGGYTYRAARSEAVIERRINGAAVQGRAPMTETVEPSDVITIRERYF